jgi:hypothetical protein
VPSQQIGFVAYQRTLGAVLRAQLQLHTLATTALILAGMSSSHSEHRDHHHLNHQPKTQTKVSQLQLYTSAEDNRNNFLKWLAGFRSF